MKYLPRIVDQRLEDLLVDAPAVAIEGAKGVGKTETAARRARTVIELDDTRQRELLQLDRRAQLSSAPSPILIDEWQLDPPIWDAVRRLVDRDPRAGRFILTGSANPRDTRIHSGAGRILRLRMRPLAFSERQLETPAVSLGRLCAGEVPEILGTTSVTVSDYADEILASGLPGVRATGPRLRTEFLDGYLRDVVSREVPALGALVRRPEALTAWLRAYSAANSTTATLEAIADAVSREFRAARSTILDYREALAGLWLLDEVPAWRQGEAQLSQLGRSPKHQLADPALAARALGVTRETLLRATTAAETDAGLQRLRNGPLLGSLFESLVTLSVRVYAEGSGFEVAHLRTRRGEHEIDLILHAPDGRVVAIEVKLAAVPDDRDVRHLNWLAGALGPQLVERVVVTAGPQAYRRADGVAVVPLALLGP